VHPLLLVIVIVVGLSPLAYAQDIPSDKQIRNEGEHIRFSPNFGIPPVFTDKRSHVLPVTYLERYPVQSTTVHLNIAQRRRLLVLFIAANAAVHRKDSTNEYVDTNSRLYLLLKYQYPEVAQYEKEGRTLIWMDVIADFAQRKLRRFGLSSTKEMLHR